MIQNAVMGSVDMPVDESGGIQAFVADTVVDATGVAVVMSEEEQEKEEERNYIRKGLLAALVITVIIVAVAVPLTIKFSFSDPGTKTILLTEAPTFFTPAPTMLPTNMPSPNDYPGMVDTLWSISGPALIESGTPQNQALDWIARDDGANRSPFDSRFVQRYVLAVFYFSTGGDQWLDCVEGEQCNRGNYWLSGDDECTWGGIVCGETPAGVFTINMGRSTGNGLKGTIPTELSAIPTLDALRIENNQIIGTIPTELGLLPRLTQLVAGNNQLVNPIPSELLDKGMLQILTLERNKFEGPIPDLSGARNLELLFLYQNDFSGEIPAFFGSLQNLELLDVSNNNLIGKIPRELADMSSLGAFYAVSNQLTGGIPVEVISSGSLHTLNLTDNSLTGTIPNSIGLMGSLIPQRQRRAIWLRDNDFFGTVPQTIGDIPDLTELVLDGNDLTGTMPASICSKETGTTAKTFKLRLLASDCAKVDCRCSAACVCSR